MGSRQPAARALRRLVALGLLTLLGHVAQISG
jgi:hypothetical protein